MRLLGFAGRWRWSVLLISLLAFCGLQAFQFEKLATKLLQEEETLRGCLLGGRGSSKNDVPSNQQQSGYASRPVDDGRGGGAGAAAALAADPTVDWSAGLSSSSPSTPQTDAERCSAIMTKVHSINDCFRHNPDCNVSAPVYHYALHEGSGFGRPIQQSVSTCYLAIALNRPCIIDYGPRDPYYTWRSFINIGSYNWDAAAVEHHAPTIEDAVLKLPGGNRGHHIFDVSLEYEYVLPLTKTENWDTAYRDWGPWNATARHKILLSPNYGLAWKHIAARRSQIPPDRIGNCPKERFFTHLQNAMYQPTVLSQYLHNERRELVVNTTHYGGIHLRTKVNDIRRLKLSRERFLELLNICLESYTQIKVWWLVADDVELAEYISNNATSTNHKVVSAYTKEFVEKNAHSRQDGNAVGLFSHDMMKQSIMDWMVLHDSDLALVTKGAFGESGARGKGKYQTGKCGNIYSVFSRSD